MLGRHGLAILGAVIMSATLATAFIPAVRLPTLQSLVARSSMANRVTTAVRVTMKEAAAVRWASDVIAERKDLSAAAASDVPEPKGAGKKKMQKVFKTLKKPKGTISVVGEIKRKDPTDPEFSINMPDPAECSKAFHDCKDLKDVVAAQASFKGEFPGPCPVLACGLFVNPDQIREAADAGAAAVVLSASVLSEELESMINSGKVSGVESVVLCGSESEVEQAVAAGATMVAIDSKLLGVNSTVEMLTALGARDGVVTAAFGGVSDISDAWRLRDAGCNSVAVGSELLYAAYGKEGEVRQGGGKDGLSASVVRGDVLQLNDVKAYARGLMAKASIKYASSSLNAFKEQGAGFKRHYTV